MYRSVLSTVAAVICLQYAAEASSECTCAVRTARGLVLKLSDEMSSNGYPDSLLMKDMDELMADFEKALNTWTTKYNFDMNKWLAENDKSMDEYMANVEKYLDQLVIPMLKQPAVRKMYDTLSKASTDTRNVMKPYRQKMKDLVATEMATVKAAMKSATTRADVEKAVRAAHQAYTKVVNQMDKDEISNMLVNMLTPMTPIGEMIKKMTTDEQFIAFITNMNWKGLGFDFSDFLKSRRRRDTNGAVSWLKDLADKTKMAAYVAKVKGILGSVAMSADEALKDLKEYHKGMKPDFKGFEADKNATKKAVEESASVKKLMDELMKTNFDKMFPEIINVVKSAEFKAFIAQMIKYPKTMIAHVSEDKAVGLMNKVFDMLAARNWTPESFLNKWVGKVKNKSRSRRAAANTCSCNSAMSLYSNRMALTTCGAAAAWIAGNM